MCKEIRPAPEPNPDHLDHYDNTSEKLTGRHGLQIEDQEQNISLYKSEIFKMSCMLGQRRIMFSGNHPNEVNQSQILRGATVGDLVEQEQQTIIRPSSSKGPITEKKEEIM